MEDRTTISSSRIASSDVARATFTPSRRGYDPREVRSYLEQVARELAAAERRIGEASRARRRCRAPSPEPRHRRGHPQERARHPERGHPQQRPRGGAAGGDRRPGAQHRAARRGAGPSGRRHRRGASHASVTVSEAEATATNVEADARAAAERLVDTAKTNSDALVDRAREQGRAIVEEAQETRRKVLADLLVRRKALHIQVEQLRVARDSLVTSVQGLRTTVDTALAELEGSDDRARKAAIDLLKSRPSPPSVGEEGFEQPQSEHPSGSAPDPEAEDPDAVEEIFAKLRKASLEERGAEEVRPTRVTVRPDSPVAAILQRRDEVASGPREGLVRKVKRALQDDQNAALERVRGVDGPAVADRLEKERDQRDRYALASVEPLREAANAGRSFAASEGGVVGPEVADGVLAGLAEDLAATLVTALRKRMTGDSGKDGTERVTAAYRDWRGARTERLCADLALRAFHEGVAATAAGRATRFVVAPAEPPCEQCTTVGASHGSGVATRLPPLHAGCRCTVLPA